MAISREVVERLGQMTRIGFEPDEIERLTADLAGILDHISAIQAIATGDDPAPRPGPLEDSVRRDEAHPSLEPGAALANAPETAGGFFVVPAVFGES